MMRLIDADAALRSLPDDLPYKSSVRRVLMQAATADAVPVVRCKDCKYWGDAEGISENANGVRFARCKVHNHVVNGAHFGWCPRVNDFCSVGERRADDGQADV